MGRGRHQRRAYLPKLTGGRKCLLSGETSALSALSKTGKRARSPLMVSARVRGPSFRKYLHPPPCPLTPRTNGSENTLKVFAYPPLSNQCIKAAKSFAPRSCHLLHSFQHFGILAVSAVNIKCCVWHWRGQPPPGIEMSTDQKGGQGWVARRSYRISDRIGTEQQDRIGEGIAQLGKIIWTAAHSHALACRWKISFLRLLIIFFGKIPSCAKFCLVAYIICDSWKKLNQYFDLQSVKLPLITKPTKSCALVNSNGIGERSWSSFF